jgi:hypothetical protein
MAGRSIYQPRQFNTNTNTNKGPDKNVYKKENNVVALQLNNMYENDTTRGNMCVNKHRVFPAFKPMLIGIASSQEGQSNCRKAGVGVLTIVFSTPPPPP